MYSQSGGASPQTSLVPGCDGMRRIAAVSARGGLAFSLSGDDPFRWPLPAHWMASLHQV